MFSPTRAIKDRFLNYAASLRFPRLAALMLALFAVDFAIPDLIPFADEVMLGLFAALLATIKKRRKGPLEPDAEPRLVNEPRADNASR